VSARIGNYELIDRFATGGVAEIYRARDVDTGAIVVVKRIRPDIDFDPEQHAGFIRELQLALMCTHKNLVRGFVKGTQNGFDYGVVEYVDGPDLARILARARKAGLRIPIEIATYLVGEVLDGLDFAFRLKDANGHQLGLVHRDLAPKNVLVRYDGQVRVGDFGSSLATLTEPRAKVVVGSPGYMSPEQARAESLDQRSDLFAAGLILFELLAGVPAFDVEGKKDAAMLKQHTRGVTKALPSDVPEDVRLVVEIATALDPEDRFQSARDMKAALAKTDTPPDARTSTALAELVRRLFAAEYQATRL
jgi:serine/threonine protein kinase